MMVWVVIELVLMIDCGILIVVILGLVKIVVVIVCNWIGLMFFFSVWYIVMWFCIVVIDVRGSKFV